MEIGGLGISDIQPSQFYISEEKIKQIEQWFDADDLSGFPPIPVKILDGIPVMTDGHTRAVVALRAGITEIPLTWEEDDLDWEMYRKCVTACRQRKIFSPADLVNRIVNAGEYREKWDQWCDSMQADVIARRLPLDGKI